MRRRDFLKSVGAKTAAFTGANILMCRRNLAADIAEDLKLESKGLDRKPASKGRIKPGGIQFAAVKERKQSNMQTVTRLIRQAAEKGAQIVMTPEVALTGFVGGQKERKLAESIPGPSTGKFSALAKELDIYILLGLSELSDGQLYNSVAVIDRKGTLMGVMRKVHICKPETSQLWRNGSQFPVWQFTTNTGIMTAGIMICYDREPPESARVLMLKGADVIFNPLGCMCPTRDIHRCLLRTRALENELYIFMVNHAAPRFNGHSMAFDFKGNIMAETGEAEELLFYEVDLDALNQQRRVSIYGKHHRRPELYGLLSDPAGQIHPDDANLPPCPASSMGKNDYELT